MTKQTQDRKIVAGLLCALMIVTAGCGAISSLVGGGSGNKATTLWSDVPAVDGATQVNADIPLPVRLAMKAFITAAANSGTSSQNDARLDNFDFIAYTTTRPVDDVKAFYSTEKMSSLGWNVKDQPGCAGGAVEAGGAGAFCLFGREDSAKKAILVIVAATDDKSKDTQLWYARFDGVSLGGN